MNGVVESLIEPSASDASDVINRGFNGRLMTVILGTCTVDYIGRASSYLGEGDRLLIAKADGTLLIHQNQNRKPINWQPSGSRHNVEVDADTLIVESKRTNPREELTAEFNELHQVALYRLMDGMDLELTGQESAMQTAIKRDPSTIEEGFRVLETEKDSEFGRIDVFGKDTDGNHVIIELKRRKVGPKVVDQLMRYIEDYRNRGYEEVRGILACPELTPK